MIARLFAIIIIPTDFQQHLLSGKNITVPVYGDGTNRLASGQQQELSKAYQTLLNAYNTQLLTKAGYSQEQAKVIITLFAVKLSHCITQDQLRSNRFSWLVSDVITALPVDCLCQYRGPFYAERKTAISRLFRALSALIPIWLFLSTVFLPFGRGYWVTGKKRHCM